MREKKRCRWLALLLAVVMLLSVLPTAVFAGEESSTDTFYKIVHVDCGRKYFSPENIKKIIDNAAAAGFNQVELYLSDNQGFRFALDDMRVTTSTGNTYDLTPALGDGYSDGSKYPDGSGKYLTQSEMTDIISYAKGKGIDIVPCVNVPGHMGAILEEFTQFKYSGSNSSIDLENAEAVAFALAITEKYATYFESQGVKFYNIGADEYANDLSTMGFQGLYTSGKYQKFVDFLNSAAQIIINHKMTPRAFNDGIYYNEDNTYSINSAIQVCYWSCGWSGYNLASAQYLVNQGMDVINTHGDYYWVLGNTSWQCSANKASQFDYTSFQYRTGTTGNGTISNPAGAMFCIWCDVGNANGTDGGTAVVSATADVIAAFGAVLPASESGGSEGGETEPTDPTDPGEGTENKTITVTVGRTATDTIEGADYSNNIVETELNKSIATVSAEYVQVPGGTQEVKATSITSGSSYYIKNTSGKYLSSSATWVSDISSAALWTATSSGSGGYTLKNGNNYLRLQNSSLSTTQGSSRATTWAFDSGTFSYTEYFIFVPISSYTLGDAYTVTTTAPVNATTVTFTGLKVGTTYVTVGNTRYTINVMAEDLSTVDPLTVEYWITNQRVTADGVTSKQISAQSAYGEAGVDISTLVPATGTYAYGSVVYWKGTVLDSSNKQTNAGGVENDKTGSGKDFNLIRYYNGSWQYFYEAGGTWNTISSTDQVVIYWLQPTEVTKEITTLVKDWGFAPDAQGDNEKKVALTVAVVYPDGTVSPAEGDMYSTSTTLFNYWSGRDIGLVAPVNNSDYEIAKITVTDGTRDQSGTGKWGINDTITWDKVTNEAGQQWYNETTYWDETVGGTPMVNGATSNITWPNYNTAKLVLIYLRPIHYDTNLIVNWVDDSASGALISTMEVAVSSDGTPITFYNGLKQASALPTEGVGGTFTLDDNAYVTNSSNVNQTFNKNISTVPDVAEQYKSGLYSYVSADLSADGKTLTLHYNIDASKLSKTFVVDFGLPISIPLSEFLKNPDEASVTLENNCVSPVGAGDANYDEINSSIVFTPSAVLNDAVAISVKVTYTGNRQETLRIGILPASNVLYEDDFLTEYQPEGKTYAPWTTKPTDLAKDAVQSSAQDTLYGYDVAYEKSTQNSMNSAWTITGLSTGNGSQYLTTTFTGNGFDLIGTAGPNTGYVYVLLKPKDDSTAKLYVVDTSYVDGSNKTLTQVPLLHAEFDTQRTYDVTIRAAYRKPTEAAGSGDTGTQMSRAAAFSMSAAPTSLDSVYDMVDAIFADGFEIDDVEYVYFDDASALAELENASRATYAMSYALDSASAAATADAEVNTTTARPAGNTVTIDGFRVYRSTDNSAYSVSEHNEYEATYVNVAEAVLNDGTNVVAFTENGSSDWTSVKDYHADGGPKWEVYLDSNLAIAFKVNTTSPVQISARAIDASAVMNVNGDPITLTSKTEMYYEVTPNEDGIVAIQATSGKLAIANIKIPAGTQTTALTDDEITKVVPMLLRMAAAPGEPDPEQPGTEEPAPKPVFTPETFKTKVSSLRTRSRKVVTLTITASTDVDHVVVNGKTYYPMNKLLVKLGWSKTCVFTIVDTAGASETRNFEIVAYNADGLSSITYTDAG